jgi:D-alanyl-lipoteichoic acid acyltransferase DltB (MBOAT superfamily)
LLSILLPIGLSFHTFQAMSYTIEVYRGHQPAERHFGIYALYVMFYPQLVAGPIERPQNLLHQFRERHEFDADRVFNGLARMLWGLFKKIVIADRLAVIVNQVYGNPEQYHGMAFVWATWFFAIQIYCDFSGYSDIAIGAAKVMGFKLMENFDRPYFSTSIGQFWRRWHISLSTWFKDYLYVPLGGSRVQTWKWCRNLMIVFLLSGLWHGAAWTYVIWGALHGTYLVTSVLTTRLRERIATTLSLARYEKILTPLKMLLTFNLVAFAWIFFRANSLHDAMHIVRQLGSLAGGLKLGIPPFTRNDLLLAIALVLLLQLIHMLQRNRATVIDALMARPAWVRWAAYYGMILLILSVGMFGAQSFIYFQF